MKLSNPFRRTSAPSTRRKSTNTGDRAASSRRSSNLGTSNLLESLRPKLGNVVEEQKRLLEMQLKAVAITQLQGLRGGDGGKTSARALVEAAAKEGVDAGARADAGGDEAAARDVVAQADALVKESNAVGGVFTAKAESLAADAVPPHEPALREAADRAVLGEAGLGDKAEAKALKAAKKAAVSKRKEIAKPAKEELETKIESQAATLLGELQTQARDEAKTRAQQEAVARKAQDQELSTLAKGPVDKGIAEIKASTTKYLAHKLGASSAHWWRSKEVRAFRGEMKAAAREQGNADADAKLRGPGELGPMRKKYVEMDAKRRIYKQAKGSVKTAVTEIAREAAKKITQEAGAKEALQAVALSAAWGKLRSDRRDTKGATKAATRAVEAAKKGIEKDAIARAKAWKDKVLAKPGRDTSRAGASSTDKEEMKSRVKERTGRDGVGTNAVDASIEASTIDKGLGKIGHLIDVAAPNPGDEISVDVELRLPIPDSPAFLVIGFSGAASRGVDSLTAGTSPTTAPTALEVEAELRFGAGIEFILGEGSATFGLFQRAGAVTTAQTMKAFSYGAYRRLASGPAKKLAGLWGGPGKGTGLTRAERSERWAAMVEEEVFAKDGDAFVEVGKSGNLGVESTDAARKLGAGTELGMRVERLRRFDRDSLTQAGYLQESNVGGSANYQVVDFDNEEQAKERRRKAKNITKSNNVTLEASIEHEVAGRTLTLAGELSFEDRKNWEFSVEAGLPVTDTGNADQFEKIAAGLTTAALGLMQLLHGRREQKAANSDENAKSRRARQVGRGVQALEGADTAFAGLQAKGAERLAEAVGSDVGSDRSFDLAIKFVVGRADGAWVTEVILSQRSVHTVELGVGNAGLTVEVERSRRLGAVGYDGSQDVGERRHGDLLGAHTTR